MLGRPDSIWTLSTDPRWNRVDAPAPSYLTREQARRWHRIRLARALYEGRHCEFFLHAGRTQFDFPESLVGDAKIRPYLTYNLLKRISHSSADLLFGDEPLIKVEDQVQQAKLKEFADRSHLHAVLVEAEIECSFAGETCLEACIEENEVYLIQLLAEEIHPIGIMRPDRQYAAYVRYAERNVGNEDNPIWLVLATTYRIGSIERHLYQIDEGSRTELDLDQWPDWEVNGVSVPLPVQPTGIAFNTIIWMPNLFVGGRVISDYDGLLEQQDALNAKETQIARVLEKHAEPPLVAPPQAADRDGNFDSRNKMLYGDPKDYAYLLFNAELEAAFKDRDSKVDSMCVASETSPVLLGVDRGGAPESARALKLRASSSISKAQRKATLRRPVLKRALLVAQLLDQTIPGNRYATGPASVEPRDGLPIDESERASTISLLRQSNSMSIERSVELQVPDPVASKREVALIKSEMATAAAASMSDLLDGEPPQRTNEATTDTSAEAA